MKDKIDREINDEVSQSAGSPTTLSKTINFLKNDPNLSTAFCFNLFTGDVEHAQDNIILSHTAKKGTSVTDIDIKCLRGYLTRSFNFSPSKENIDDALVDCAMFNKYHPVKQYLEKLKWDGIPRLDRWLTEICGVENNVYSQSVGRKIFISAIKRIYEPGCWFAQLVIFEGRQRMFKSRLVQEMGRDWYASIHLKTQDTKTLVEDMRGKWILEIEELAGFGKQETEYMKAFVSRQTDRVRLSYGHRAEDHPRQSIMIATMNPDGENRYLIDPTGNFRYWPIKCGDKDIEIDVFKDVRDQLFAEAKVAYNKGETLWLGSKEEDELAQKEQEKRLSVDPWGPIISGWLDDEVKLKARVQVTANEIALGCLRMIPEKINAIVWRRISRVLIESGWKKYKSTSKKDRHWFYTAPGVVHTESGEKWTE